jgi:Flp pilus assembly protein TadB
MPIASRRQAPISRSPQPSNIDHHAGGLLSPLLRFVEPNKAAERFHNEESGSMGEASREEEVNSNFGSHYRDRAEYQRDHVGLRDQFQRETVLPLGAALIIIVLLSLGLWCLIWLVVSSLVPDLLA